MAHYTVLDLQPLNKHKMHYAKKIHYFASGWHETQKVSLVAEPWLFGSRFVLLRECAAEIPHLHNLTPICQYTEGLRTRRARTRTR